MTTEQKLREALATMPHMPHCNRTWVGAKPGLSFGGCTCGRDAAIAIPPSATREEFIVRFESLEYFPERWEATSLKYANKEGALWVAANRDRQPRFYRNVRVESRTVSVSPLMPVALPVEKAVPAEKVLPAEKE